jgi:cysteine-rich repeat protein
VTKSLLGKFGMLAMTAAIGTVALGGCSSSLDKSSTDGSSARSEDTGEVGLQLRPQAGIDINEVKATVTKGATLVAEQILPTPGTESTFSFGLSLPVGTGYTLTLTGESAATGDDITCTGSFGPFDVTSNATTDISLPLVCTDNTKGTIVTDVTVETDACPRLLVNYAVATPSSAVAPGGTIAVLSSATDLDGKPVTYSWSVANAAVGAFTAPTSANTTFTCGAAGGDDVVITVTADNGECDTTLDTKISCVNLTCGNGVLDAGEDCDFGAPLNQACPLDCTVSCGDGIAEAPVEDCDPPVAGFCSATCQDVPPLCGDTFVQAGETCDDGNTASGDGCSATCQTETLEAPCNGNGILLPGEFCDPAVKYSVENCGADCQPISNTACQDCAAANCAGAETCVGTPNPIQCNDTLDCVRDSGCADGGFALFCYCGAVSSTECDTPGGAAGACKAEIEAGLGNTDPIFIQNNLFDIGLSAGRAMARVDCELGSSCSTCF